MRKPLSALLALTLAGCGGDPQPIPRDELETGSFRRVQVFFWSDPAGAGSAHVTARTCSDGATVTREHLVAFDPLETDEPAWWADVTIEVTKEGRASRLHTELGVGSEPASAPRRLRLERQPGGRWTRVRADDTVEELPQLDGCDDVEIVGDHVSAGLPARRLSLADGESADVEVVLVTLPSLDLARAKRRISRVDAGTWAVETPGSDGVPGSRIEVRLGPSGLPVEIVGPEGRRHILRDVTLE